ncbi:MAG: ferritin-like domain-containing protein [Clostridia bacterium]|jgi:bacterioferritin|nr:ferritin-like domain-containing protein [Clostridia bacterium]MDD3232335.1 ferritin-like domain-containing protein [Clostridia bacterium]MDD3862544.1 ferritin-like domain-containing protein [Clostridia bacterium]MDD4408560.1 ferritin-like domain-containing protein [Clostridia bacterium]
MDELGLKKFHYNKVYEVKTNPFYSEILQNLYMGNSGEVYSYLQLCYQSFLLSPFGESLGVLFEKIASEDFWHMKILAQQIITFGGNPIFANQGIWLGARTINYSKNAKSMLIADIELKEKSIIDYKTALLKIEDKNLKILLKSIIAEEEYHLSLFKKSLDKLH